MANIHLRQRAWAGLNFADDVEAQQCPDGRSVLVSCPWSVGLDWNGQGG